MIYRHPDPGVLAEMAAFLKADGFSVSPIVVPENVWTDGNPYFDTNASGHDIVRARRAVGAGSGRRSAKRKSSGRKRQYSGVLRARKVSHLPKVKIGRGRSFAMKPTSVYKKLLAHIVVPGNFTKGETKDLYHQITFSLFHGLITQEEATLLRGFLSAREA